jgi:hypothetical protein
VPSDKSRNPPTGPKAWRDNFPKPQRRSRRSERTKQNPPKETTKLEQLETEIFKLKEKIKQKEQAKDISHKCSGPQDNEYQDKILVALGAYVGTQRKERILRNF